MERNGSKGKLPGFGPVELLDPAKLLPVYALRYDSTIEAIWDSLPREASEQFTLSIANACEDPFSATEPFGIDDGHTRLLQLPHVVAMLYLDHEDKELRVYSLDYLA
jgi:hypothetical protein